VLETVRPEDYAALSGRVQLFASQLASVIEPCGIAVQVPVAGPLAGIFFADSPVSDYTGARESASNGRYARFFAAMLDRDVALPPSPYEALFPGMAHGTEELDLVVEAAGSAAAELVGGGD
jgi:glutamate-1-semialdehyde 2,1-aminomutase